MNTVDWQTAELHETETGKTMKIIQNYSFLEDSISSAQIESGELLKVVQKQNLNRFHH